MRMDERTMWGKDWQVCYFELYSGQCLISLENPDRIWFLKAFLFVDPYLDQYIIPTNFSYFS